MLRILSLAALGTCLVAGPLVGQEPPARPEGPAPAMHLAVFRDGKIRWTALVTTYRTEKVTKQVKGPDDQPMEVVEDVIVAYQEARDVELDPEKATIVRADGQPVSAEDAAQLLEQPTAVFLSRDFKPVDRWYLQFLADEALIIVPPPPPPAVAIPRS